MIKIYKNEEPFISVIICTYNRAYLLPRALKSLENQTWRNWEALIVDDGSKDNTSEIALEYCMKYSNFRYMYHQNKGLGYSRNSGILASAGKYITFLDSDDEYLPEHLESRSRILKDKPAIDLLYGGIEVIGSPFVPDVNNPGEKIHLDDCVVGGTFFIRRESALKLGGFGDMNFADDFHFFRKALNGDLVIMETDKRTYRYYRDTVDAITRIV